MEAGGWTSTPAWSAAAARTPAPRICRAARLNPRAVIVKLKRYMLDGDTRPLHGEIIHGGRALGLHHLHGLRGGVPRAHRHRGHPHRPAALPHAVGGHAPVHRAP